LLLIFCYWVDEIKCIAHPVPLHLLPVLSFSNTNNFN
jgi:hypothetical protein